ncbi:hypothetical protein D3C87_1899630 [compost metagenome]
MIGFRVAAPGLALDRDLAFMRRHQAQNMLHGRAFACSVQSNQTDHFSRLHLKADIMKHRLVQAVASA